MYRVVVGGVLGLNWGYYSTSSLFSVFSLYAIVLFLSKKVSARCYAFQLNTGVYNREEKSLTGEPQLSL